MNERPRFRSPWSLPAYGAGVQIARWALRLCGRSEKQLIQGLVAAQNARVRAHLARHPAHTLLLILPRCVKRPGCSVDVRGELHACAVCRECPLGEIARLTQRRGVSALVAFRSHHALAMARRERPDLIIAAACEDRLIKALRRVPGVPALLSPLTEMRQPCAGAQFDLRWVLEQAASALDAPDDRAARAAAR